MDIFKAVLRCHAQCWKPRYHHCWIEWIWEV